MSNIKDLLNKIREDIDKTESRNHKQETEDVALDKDTNIFSLIPKSYIHFGISECRCLSLTTLEIYWG